MKIPSARGGPFARCLSTLSSCCYPPLPNYHLTATCTPAAAIQDYVDFFDTRRFRPRKGLASSLPFPPSLPGAHRLTRTPLLPRAIAPLDQFASTPLYLPLLSSHSCLVVRTSSQPPYSSPMNAGKFTLFHAGPLLLHKLLRCYSLCRCGCYSTPLPTAASFQPPGRFHHDDWNLKNGHRTSWV